MVVRNLTIVPTRSVGVLTYELGADKRGVVVKVYSVPIGDRRDRRDRRTNDEAIRRLEEGQGQRYFY